MTIIKPLCVKINNFYEKQVYFPSHRKLVIYIFENLFNVWLPSQAAGFLIGVSACDLLQNTVLVEVSEENLDLHGYVMGKGRSSVAFLDTVDILLRCHTQSNKW